MRRRLFIARRRTLVRRFVGGKEVPNVLREHVESQIFDMPGASSWREVMQQADSLLCGAHVNETCSESFEVRELGELADPMPLALPHRGGMELVP